MKRISILLLLVIFTIVTGLQSCEKLPPIDEQKFARIYADMIFMQDTSSLSQLVIKNKVLKKYSIIENDYDETINFYNDDPERWLKFFDSTVVYIEKLKPKPKKVDVKSLPKQFLSVDKKNL